MKSTSIADSEVLSFMCSQLSDNAAYYQEICNSNDCYKAKVEDILKRLQKLLDNQGINKKKMDVCGSQSHELLLFFFDFFTYCIISYYQLSFFKNCV